MKPGTRLGVPAIAAALLSLAVAAPVFADTITVSGRDTGQYSTATVVCEFNAQTNTFTFTATNTSAITQPGSTAAITSIAFDLPPAGNASPSGLNGFTGSEAPTLSSDFDFTDTDMGAVPGLPTVVLDFGFVTVSPPSFSDGSVEDGLLPGESASFTVSGAAFAGFTEEQICNALLLRFENVPSAGGASVDVGVSGSADFESLQPDARIKRSGGTLKGDDVYNTTADGQTQTLRRSGASVRRVWLTIQNDGDTADSFELDVSGATPEGYDLRYFHARTRVELTTAIESGTFVTAELAPDQVFRIRIRVVTTADAQVGSELTRMFTFTSEGDSDAKDAAKLIVTRV